MNTINTDEYHIGPGFMNMNTYSTVAGIHEYEYIWSLVLMNMNTYGAWYS